MTSKPTFWRRHRRTINLWTFFAFLLSLLVTIFTPPTYQVASLISLPPGIHAADIAAHLQAETSQLPAQNSDPNNDPRFYVRPEGHDSPELVALVAEAKNPNGLAEIANGWASIAVDNLGGKASILGRALSPQFPVRPKKGQDILVGTFLGFLVGLGIAGLRESGKKRGVPLTGDDSTA